MNDTPLRFAPLLAAALLSSGCATVLHTAHDDLKVVTDPPGATAHAGEASIVTPGILKIARRGEPVVVRVEKEGFAPRELTVGWHRSGAAWTNVVGVGLGATGTLVSTRCTMTWGGGDGHCSGDATPLIVGAALTAVGTAIDLSSDRALSLERDEIVLRLEPLPPAVAAGGGAR
ncbi:MAG: hypothetical protein IPL90_06985 [Holophagales bacterium]|nr:hypothetical protein [Holophagales bacterium]